MNPKIKAGARVRWTRRNGAVASGRVERVEEMANGKWVVVNVADKGKPKVTARVRISQLEVL